MQEGKRILLIGDFKEYRPKAIRIERRRWFKGFIRLGHDVQIYNHKNALKIFSLLKSDRVVKVLGKKGAYHALIQMTRYYQPDIVMILTMKYLKKELLSALRKQAPSAIFVGRDNDPFPKKRPYRMEIARQMDIVIATNAGSWLQDYKDSGVRKCAFIPNPCDPDIQRHYALDPRFETDIIFTGTSVHSKRYQYQEDPDRYDIVERLSKMPNARIYGCFGRKTIEGIDCFRAISSSKLALSINAANNIRLYHSDRLVNCVSCGTFTLAKRVPDSNVLFNDGEHLVYFNSSDEFFELAEWYLNHDDDREKIAKAGMERAHREFNCTRLAQYVLDLIYKGSYEAPWAYVL